MADYSRFMLCSACKTKEATVFLTQMVQGHVKKINLCSTCSKKQGLADSMESLLSDFFQGLGVTQEETASSTPALICPACGFSQVTLKKQTRLGCSLCYDIFSETLHPMLRNMHRDVVHKGKVPAKIAAAYHQAHEFEQLKTALKEAIKSERYEEAALHRDRIALLENALKGETLQEIKLQKKKPTVLKEKKTSASKKRLLEKPLEKKMKKPAPLLPPETGISSS